MNVSQIMCKMIAYSQGNHHDINHLMKVYAYARTIGVCEGVSRREQEIIEIAAILHDIACPLCREKYGNTNGKYQEKEGTVLAREFLADCGLPEDMAEIVLFYLDHRHTNAVIDEIEVHRVTKEPFA